MVLAFAMVFTGIYTDGITVKAAAGSDGATYVTNGDTTTWDFTKGTAISSGYAANTDIGGGLLIVTGGKIKMQNGYLSLNKADINVPLKDDTTSVQITLVLNTVSSDRYLEIGTGKVKVAHADFTDKAYTATFSADSFTDVAGKKYLYISSITSNNETKIASISITESTEGAGSTVKAPTASPESGEEVLQGTTVELTTETAGAAIYYTYTKDGSEPADPTADSTPYPEGGIVLNDVGTIRIKAIAISGTGDEVILSKVVPFTYTVKEETILEPKPSIASDTKVQKDTTLELETETKGAEIYYTLNGDEPTESSTKYDGAFSLGSSTGTVTVKAIAIKGEKKSPVVTFTYTITGDKLVAPTATPAAGAVARGTKVTLSYPGEAVEGVVIHYTTDGSTPGKSSTVYASGSPIEITKEMEIKAIAMSDKNADSDVATFKYTIKKPKISVASGSESILSNAVLNGDITFKNGSGAEIFDIAIKAEKVSSPSEAVKGAAEALKENGGEILYYDFTLANKESASDTVSVVKGEVGADGVAPAISIKMPYSIASSEVSKLNEIIVLHGTEKVTSVGKEAEGFSFSMDEAGSYAVIVNPRPEGQSLVKITEWEGYEEGAYAEWEAVEGADGYMAYVAPSGGTWTRIDNELIREYKDYWRVDTVGLAKGNYFIKIDAVTLSADKKTATVIASNTTEVLKVTNYDRSGFAFSEVSKTKTGSGAYNEDGTLKEGAKVLYVNNENFNTVTLTVQDSNKKDVTFTGIQEIVYEGGVIKTAPDTPIDIRIIGTIDITGFPKDLWKSSAEGLQIKSPKGYTNRHLTIEGIGEDAAVSGFGFLVKNCGNVEFRNFAVMNFADDGISLDGDNSNVWIHDMDFFYGNPGGDSDQAKGDGTIDLKDNTMYCTFSYNHFWDSGKSSLCGMKSESGPNYITYHHNWFDHSDSRHPRIRTMSVHVYNNYFDGNSKYGVGMTMGGSAFVEANYFRNCKDPMLISMQGTDAKGAGTFSKESGGIIKAYNNHIEGAHSFIPYSTNPTDFDAYVVENADEKVPESVKAKAGGTSYDNFDTASTMYDYVADMPEEAKEKVVSNAGRLNGGDLQWIFDNTKEDTNYGVISGLKEKVVNYKPGVVDIGGKVEGNPDVVEMSGGGSTNVPIYTPKNVSDPEADPSSRQVEKGTTIALKCATDGASIYYTLDGSIPTTSSIPYNGAIVIEKSTTVKAIAVYGGEQSDVKSFYYTVIGEGTGVNPGPGVGDDEEFETRIYMFNPEADGMEAVTLPENVTQYGTDGYFTIDNAAKTAKISLISTSDPPKPKDAPAETHGGQEEYLLRFSFGGKTTKDSKQAIRFTNEYAAKVYIGAYVSKTDATAGKTKIYLDTDENATDPCVNVSTEYVFDVEAGEHVIYAKDDGTAYILYVVVEEQVPVTPSTVADPVASQASGEVPKGTKVTLSTTTAGAKIYYTLDGTNPTTESTEYTGAIDLGSVEKAVTLKAFAVLNGKESQVVTYEYQVTDIDPTTFVSTPVANPVAGKVDKGAEVTLTCATEGAKIYYTLDGTNPTAESEEYKNSPIVIEESVTIKAIAIKGENSSKIGVFTYTVGTENPPQDVTVSDPVAAPAAGAVAKGTKISLTSATEDAKIYYTTDKTEPTTKSELYKEPILITEAMTIKAIAVKEGCKDSAVVTFEYTLADSTMEQAKAPKATPGADMVSTRVAKGTEVKLSSVTADAKIYYTTDGTVPTKNSTLYEKAIVIEKDTTIKAIAVKEGFIDSAVATFVYKVLPDDVDYGDITPEDIEELIEKYEAGTDENKTLIPDGLWIAGLSSEGYAYTGSAIRPEVRVYNKNVMLREKADYTISYKNNLKANANVDVNADQKTLTRAKAPMVTVTGKGNYGGKEVAAFKILPIDISDDEAFEADEMSFDNVNKAKKQVPVLYWNGKSLKKKTDYVVAGYYKQKDITDMVGTPVGSITEAGDYLVELEGKGNFTGKLKVEWHVDASRKLISGATVKKIPDQEYTRGGATPLPEVSFKGAELHQGSDYLVSYSNNEQPGVAYVIITGINDYTGTKRVAFKVLGTPLKGATVTGIEDRVYDGDEQEMDIDVVLNGAKLIEGDDYTVTYSSNVKVGKAVVTITGINAYSGVIKKNFRIKAYDVADELIKGTSDITAKYMKGGAKPQLHLTFDGVALREGVDYSVTYKNNKAYPATRQPQLVIKGKGNFTGTTTVDFTIEAKTLKDVVCVVPDVAKNSAGKYINKPVLTDVDGKKLAVNKDYEIVSYKAKGAELPKSGAELTVGDEITVELKGKGAYAGQSDAEAVIAVTYKVTEADFSKAKITIKPQSYTGKAVTLTKDDITVKVGGTEVAKGDYEILPGSYINNVKKGTAQVTLVGQNGYGGAKTVKFKIGACKFQWIWRLFSK